MPGAADGLGSAPDGGTGGAERASQTSAEAQVVKAEPERLGNADARGTPPKQWRSRARRGQGAAGAPDAGSRTAERAAAGAAPAAGQAIPLKASIPQEAMSPTMQWRLYIFSREPGASRAPRIKNIHREPGYLFGKDRRIVDVGTDHPSCSKQHAVIHFRAPDGGEVRPYVMDLGSTNGTALNGERVSPHVYVEMRERDTLHFGLSSKEFMLMQAGPVGAAPEQRPPHARHA